MDVECPYCTARIAVSQLERHVRMYEEDGHGSHGTVPMDGVDNPWNLRIDTTDRPADADEIPSVDFVEDDVRQGRCPACDMGVLGFKGGDGIIFSSRRRLACIACGWESPEWLKIRN